MPTYRERCTWKVVVGLVNNQRTCEVAAHWPGRGRLPARMIGNLARVRDGNLMQAPQPVRMCDPSNAPCPRPHGLFDVWIHALLLPRRVLPAF